MGDGCCEQRLSYVEILLQASRDSDIDLVEVLDSDGAGERVSDRGTFAIVFDRLYDDLLVDGVPVVLRRGHREFDDDAGRSDAAGNGHDYPLFSVRELVRRYYIILNEFCHVSIPGPRKSPPISSSPEGELFGGQSTRGRGRLLKTDSLDDQLRLQKLQAVPNAGHEALQCALAGFMRIQVNLYQNAMQSGLVVRLDDDTDLSVVAACEANARCCIAAHDMCDAFLQAPFLEGGPRMRRQFDRQHGALDGCSAQ